MLFRSVCEVEYPWRVLRSELIGGSAGGGRWRGGRGVRRTYQVLAEAQRVVLYCEQTDPRFRPWGSAGGGDGAPTRVTVRGADRRRMRVPPKGTITLAPGSTVTIETGGGGGYGPPAARAVAGRAD